MFFRLAVHAWFFSLFWYEKQDLILCFQAKDVIVFDWEDMVSENYGLLEVNYGFIDADSNSDDDGDGLSNVWNVLWYLFDVNKLKDIIQLLICSSPQLYRGL